MPAISSSVGLVSGLNTGEIIDALINAQKGTINRLTSRQTNYANSATAFQSIEAVLVSATTSTDSLSKAATFTKLNATSGDPAALTATAGGNATAGTTTLTPLRKASAQVLASKSFAASTQPVGAGTVSIARGGEVNTDVSLARLNGGAGVRLGTIRVTDAAGAAADVDLSSARSVGDVLDAINAGQAAVTAEVRDGRFVINDRSGGAGTVSVRDLGAGAAASDLGIAATGSASRLTGGEVFSVGTSTSLSQINDGNAPRFVGVGTDLRATLADGTPLDFELSAAKTVGDVLDAVNNQPENGGKLTASLADGRIVLTDNTTGAGNLAVADRNGASVARALGLDRSSAGGTLTGGRLSGGLSGVLLKNLRGGQGIAQLGQVALTDRSGATATVDLSNAETLGDVLSAINDAQTAGGQKLGIRASVDDSGLGLVLRDASGGAASNLVVADVGPGTTAADLGLATDSANTTVRGGALGRRYVGEATSLTNYAAGGKPVRTGSFTVTDTSGASTSVTITATEQTIGDVLDRINASAASAGVQVTAKLNDTGDGIALVDDAGGTGSLSVADDGSGKVASDLGLAGTGVVGTDGKARVTARQAISVTLSATDTLADLSSKLSAAGAGLSAQVVADGSGSSRLLVTASKTGSANRLRIDDGGLNLGLGTLVAPKDALLRIGDDPATGLLIASDTNHFDNLPGGLSVDLLKAGGGPVSVAVARDTAGATATLKQFVATYNQYLDGVGTLTKFDSASGSRGILQGDGTILRVSQKLSGLLIGNYGTDPAVRNLTDLGVSFSSAGKLSLDEDKLAAVFAANPDAVKAFFTDSAKGFGVKTTAAVKSLTDPFTGTFKTQEDSLTKSADALQTRIDQLNSILDSRREHLVQQFAKLEDSLGALQSQQQSLTSFSNSLSGSK